MSVKAILFDLDGTLVVTANHWSERLACQLQPLCQHIPGLNPRRIAKRLVNTIELASTYGMLWLEHLGISTNFFGLADRIRRSKGLATQAASTLVTGSIELLQVLAPKYKLAVVTTRQRPETLAFISTANIAHYFEVVITRSDSWLIKPNPAPVRRAAKQLGVQPADCLMLGDTRLDIRSARRAGARAIGVLTGYDDHDELCAAGAEVVLESASLLPGYLARTGS